MPATDCIFPTREHDDYDPAPRAAHRPGAWACATDRSSDDSSSDQESCGSGSTSEANDIFDTLDASLGYGSTPASAGSLAFVRVSGNPEETRGSPAL